MSREREHEERPCLHCLMVELIDDFFAEHPATAGSDKVDTSEADQVIDAVAKTAGWAHTPASYRGVDATDRALRRGVSPGRGGLSSRLSGEALTAVRIDWSTDSIRPPGMLDRPGVIWRCDRIPSEMPIGSIWNFDRGTGHTPLRLLLSIGRALTARISTTGSPSGRRRFVSTP